MKYKNPNKRAYTVIVAGVLLVFGGFIASLSALFSIYDEVGSNQSCLGASCDIAKEVTAAAIGKYAIYAGLALVVAGIIYILLESHRRK